LNFPNSIIYIHFHSSPATNKQSIDNCKQIVDTLSNYQVNSELYLYPILDIKPFLLHPVEKKSINQLSKELTNKYIIKKLSYRNLI